MSEIFGSTLPVSQEESLCLPSRKFVPNYYSETNASLYPNLGNISLPCSTWISEAKGLACLPTRKLQQADSMTSLGWTQIDSHPSPNTNYCLQKEVIYWQGPLRVNRVKNSQGWLCPLSPSICRTYAQLKCILHYPKSHLSIKRKKKKKEIRKQSVKEAKQQSISSNTLKSTCPDLVSLW